MWHDHVAVLKRWFRLVLAVAMGFALVGAASPAEAQLWKPSKQKPAVKAKSGPPVRKVAKPTKRKPKAAKVRPRKASPEVTSANEDDAPIITIYPADE